MTLCIKNRMSMALEIHLAQLEQCRSIPRFLVEFQMTWQEAQHQEEAPRLGPCVSGEDSFSIQFVDVLSMALCKI